MFARAGEQDSRNALENWLSGQKLNTRALLREYCLTPIMSAFDNNASANNAKSLFKTHQTMSDVFFEAPSWLPLEAYGEQRYYLAIKINCRHSHAATWRGILRACRFVTTNLDSVAHFASHDRDSSAPGMCAGRCLSKMASARYLRKDIDKHRHENIEYQSTKCRELIVVERL